MFIRHNFSIQPTYQSPRSDRSTAKDKQYVYSNPEVHICIFRPIHLGADTPDLTFQGPAADTLKNSQESSHIVLMRSNLQKRIILTDPDI
jgi:hypothetical protein